MLAAGHQRSAVSHDPGAAGRTSMSCTDYLVEQDVICSVSHPLYRVNGRLTIDHIEKLILMFSRFEAINGARDRRGQELVRRGAAQSHARDDRRTWPTGTASSPRARSRGRSSSPAAATTTAASTSRAAYTATPLRRATWPSSSPICAAATMRPAALAAVAWRWGTASTTSLTSYYKDRFLAARRRQTDASSANSSRNSWRHRRAAAAGGIGPALRGLATGWSGRRQIEQAQRNGAPAGRRFLAAFRRGAQARHGRGR